jgi:hypothetical protein
MEVCEGFVFIQGWKNQEDQEKADEEEQADGKDSSFPMKAGNADDEYSPPSLQ